ncbi:DUF5336 domain-containing protein [Streptomyces sp. ACA25]|uniref:DUF5336 domain-containing protein n=1 Tax=Streptomyces sp. ACA25 TaxID=3022596 RepID=UPI002307AD44|nr:DUF5336 domain-containing protein [Streptomyces sp. ACA25]MDB1087794.1 DUF5336 domain-containing protein [Streptomyces sp. ACA25]
MNNRSLTRGDAAVAGAAVLLFIFSFLPFYSFSEFGGGSTMAWSSDLFPVLPSIFLAGIIGGGLIVGSRFLPQKDREFGGLRLDQWGIALSVFSLWTAFWTLVGGPSGATGAGQVLAFITTILLAAGAVATPLVPALKAPLLSGTPAQPAVPGAPGQPQPGQAQPGYGYPGGAPQQPYGAQPAAAQPYGAQPGAPGQPQQPQQGAVQPQPTAPDPNFQPFWFAVPAQRPLYAEDGSQAPVAELAPGTWYLAVEQRGQALVAQTQDGRRGVLQDSSDIQRG